MKQVILYGSRYGSTKLYAQKLSELTGVECHCYKEKLDFKSYDKVVYMGSLFGGAVNGLKKTAKKLNKNVSLILVTNGILDITVKDNYDYVKKTSLGQIPNYMVDNTVVHCLMGKSVYDTMKWSDKLVMNIVHKGMSKKPESERTQNEMTFIDNFKTVADMMDYEALKPIIEDMNK